MNNSRLLKKKPQNTSKRLPIKIEFHASITDSEETKSNNLFKILTKSFKPIVEVAHKKYIKDQYSHVVQKIETERLNLTGKKSEFDKIYEKLFKKTLPNGKSILKKSKSQNKILANYSLNNNNDIKSLKQQQGQSFLFEHKIIEKNDILNIPFCNRDFMRISKTPDITSALKHKKAFYERDLLKQKAYNDKKAQMRFAHEQKELSELQATPIISANSQKIVAQSAHLALRAPVHLRFKELLEQKSLKRRSLRNELLKRNESSALSRNRSSSSSFAAAYAKDAVEQDDGRINFLTYNYNYNSNNNNDDNANNGNNDFGVYARNKFSNSNNSGGYKCLAQAKSCNTRDFASWVESKLNWLKRKDADTENLRNAFSTLKKQKEAKQTTFSPEIDAKSDFIATLKKNQSENQSEKIHEKLYNLQAKKLEKIEYLQQKYKPSFKPNINKAPLYLLNNNKSKNQTTFFVEEKEDNYANFVLSAKSKAAKTENSGTTRTASRQDRKSRSRDLGCFNNYANKGFDKKHFEKKNIFVEKNKRAFKKSQKDVEDFFHRMNKGQSPNLVLEVEDIKFYNNYNSNNNLVSNFCK